MFIVFSNAFSFLSTMPKQRNIVNVIHERIGKGSNPSYGNYLGWVTLALAKRFRWFMFRYIIIDFFCKLYIF